MGALLMLYWRKYLRSSWRTCGRSTWTFTNFTYSRNKTTGCFPEKEWNTFNSLWGIDIPSYHSWSPKCRTLLSWLSECMEGAFWCPDRRLTSAISTNGVNPVSRRNCFWSKGCLIQRKTWKFHSWHLYVVIDIPASVTSSKRVIIPDL